MSFTPRASTSNVPTLPKWLGLVVLAVWSLVIVIGYMLADGLLGWLIANAGSVVQAGRDLGTAVAPELNVALDAFGGGDIWTSLILLARAILMPAFVVIWLLGAIVIVVLPRILGKVVSMVSNRR